MQRSARKVSLPGSHRPCHDRSLLSNKPIVIGVRGVRDNLSGSQQIANTTARPKWREQVLGPARRGTPTDVNTQLMARVETSVGTAISGGRRAGVALGEAACAPRSHRRVGVFDGDGRGRRPICRPPVQGRRERHGVQRLAENSASTMKRRKDCQRDRRSSPPASCRYHDHRRKTRIISAVRPAAIMRLREAYAIDRVRNEHGSDRTAR